MGRWYRYTSGSWVAQDGPSVGTTGDEFAFWQKRAALLDPAAYELLVGSAATDTVDTGQTWYVVAAWNVDVGTPSMFHRKPDVLSNGYVPLISGETITLEADAAAHAWICKPALVTGVDARYTTDPKGLFYERVQRIDTELTKYDVGHDNTGATGITTAFPTDFTDGLVIHCSSHDVAWTGLEHSSTNLALNLNNEVSDSDRIRFAERVVMPFDRTIWPKVKSQGVSEAQGTVNVRYCKLPGDW